MSRLHTWQADLALLGVTVVWGATFVTVKTATLTLPVLPFLAVRFALAAAALVVPFPSTWDKYRVPLVLKGTALGAFLFLGYLLQTWGLQYTTAGKAGFITGLTVVLVPLGQALIWRRSPGSRALAGVGLATAGLAMMGWEGGRPGLGDLLVLGCTLAFATHILGVAAWAREHHPIPITAVQVGTVALGSTLASLLPGSCPSSWSWQLLPSSVAQVWDALLLTGILATSAAFLAQNAVQQFTDPTHTALIFAAEPVFAALFGWLQLGETLSPRCFAGGALVVLGMLSAQLPNRHHRPEQGTPAASRAGKASRPRDRTSASVSAPYTRSPSPPKPS